MEEVDTQTSQDLGCGASDNEGSCNWEELEEKCCSQTLLGL
jgi:hypothetical protein